MCRSDSRVLASSRIALVLIAVGAVSCAEFGPDVPSRPEAAEVAPTFVTTIPSGYRDWKLISVAREEGELDDIRAVLGNDVAIEACRNGTRPFPDGAILARIAWSYDVLADRNAIFDPARSFVAGAPKNGVQFMVKDSKKYAATGGWGFAHFDDGRPAAESVLRSCFPCHAAASARDLVFARYAP